MSRRAGALIKTSASLMKIRRRMCQNDLEIALLFLRPFFLDSRKNLSAWQRARRESSPLRENEAGFFRRLPRRCAPRNDEKSVGFQQAYLLLPSHLYCHCERSEAISSCIFKLKPYSALSLVPSRDSGSPVQSCFFSVTSGLFSDPLCKSCNFVPSLYSLYSC